MTKHAFLGGMGLGILAGAAIGMAVAAKPKGKMDMQKAAHRAARRLERMKDDLTDVMGL